MDNIYNFHSTSYEFSTDKPYFPPLDDYSILQSHDQYQDLLMMASNNSSDHGIFGSEELLSAAGNLATPQNQDGLIKSRIASHPCYPRLLDAHIDCQKVGAPPEIASILDKTRRENEICKRVAASSLYGDDPELDEFMEAYCDVLVKYKSDLEKPFDEAKAFLNNMEMQLHHLSTAAAALNFSEHQEDTLSSEEELSGGELEATEAIQQSSEEKELKDSLIRRFGNHISSLKLEFSKKKKKGKLPKEARQTLLQWWNLHFQWPYPTEADKIALAESTGLNPKQINNWFINQRKRHWNPSESLQFAAMNSLSSPLFTDD